MNKLDTFLKEHGTKAILFILLLTYFKGCGNKSELKYIKKELKATQEELIIQKYMIDNLPTSLDLQIEGLKSEKRMIQSTDRKMYDVQRQNEIERMIDELETK
jgi:hypothetical protein